MLQCCRASTWTHLSSSNKIQRNYMGLKITACKLQLGQILDKRYKETKKPNCHFWRVWSKSRGLGAKAGYCTCPLHTTPPKRWAKHLSHPSGRPLDTPLPSPHIRNKLASPPPARGASKRGKPLFVLTPPCCSRGPNNALPEFLVWPLINFF